MGFIDEVRSNAVKFKSRLKDIKTEEATKNALVMPFIKMLGYDIEEPTEVEPEFTADVGVKKGAKVDYALLRDGCPIILIEAKKYGDTLSVGHEAQLLQYFHVTDARFAILTDGITYRFYSDLDSLNKMDDRPFFELNMLEVSPEQMVQLKRFCKNDFKLKEALEAARELRYMNDIKLVLAEEIDSPCDEFVRFLLNRIESPGSKTTVLTEQFSSIVQQAFTRLIDDRVNVRQQSAGTLSDEYTKSEEREKSIPFPECHSELFLHAKGIRASARRDNGAFVVLAGSQAVKQTKPSTADNARKMRQSLLGNGGLQNAGNVYRLTRNCSFNSPSGAAGFLLGFSANGKLYWKDAKGRSLKELQS